MSKARTLHRCRECGTKAPRWTGRCGGCGSWNSLDEEHVVPPSVAGLGAWAEPPVPIAEVEGPEGDVRPTGLEELDRVLGGGLVPGSVTLLAGEPGIGKSTLVLQALSALAASGARCLLASAEESRPQVRLRAERLGATHPSLWLVADTVLPHLVAHTRDLRPDFLVVDSIQTVLDPELGSSPGTVTQVRECAAQLVRLAKETGVSVVLVGHVTKEGTLAGPRVLEHVVDTVLAFEGERHHALRLLRAPKHRFGSTQELGLFEMGDEGLRQVPDPGALFLGDRQPGAAGSVVAPTLEGHRPLVVEVQALAAKSKLAMPRRSAQGLDAGRLAIVLAVLEKRCGLQVQECDVFASAVGGVRVTEPGADLPLALAVASSLIGQALPPDVVACGEVGLAGEVRQVAQTGRRLAEAARLGFRRAVVPASAPDTAPGLELLRAGALTEAMGLLGWSSTMPTCSFGEAQR